MGWRRRFSRANKLLLAMLILSLLVVCSRAVPCTRIPAFAQNRQGPGTLRSSRQDSSAMEVGSHWREAAAKEEEITGDGRRMDLELNDYPGSGANNRHIPKPPNRK